MRYVNLTKRNISKVALIAKKSTSFALILAFVISMILIPLKTNNNLDVHNENYIEDIMDNDERLESH